MKQARDYEDATPERLNKAGEDVATLEGVRYLADTPLQRLYNRGALSRDPAMNARLFDAGEKFYRDWYLSGMETLAAQDITRQGSGDGCASGMPASERQAIHRQAWRKANEKLGARYRKVVELVVLEGNTDLVAVGKDVSGYAKRETARAVGLDRLIGGLEILEEHYRTRH